MNLPSSLFPEIEPYQTGKLQVSPTHTLYFEQCGNPQGKPVVFVHGGPGGGTNGTQRRFFDPKKYRVILFDQRGCGKSTPHACLDENTTWHLVDDIEKVRTHLNIDKWMVFGGSWGSTLSLAYAQTHPEKVTELVLRGIFMLRQKELHWFYQEGASYLFPDAWEKYLAPIPENERHDLLSAYYKRLTSENKETKVQAARAWSVWEASTSKLIQDADLMNSFGDETFATAFARIECHYFVNKGFFDADDFLLRGVHKIRKIPAVIVQGRYDVVCPMQTAWELHRAWPEAEFKIIPDAGHGSIEVGIANALVQATEKFSGT